MEWTNGLVLPGEDVVPSHRAQGSIFFIGNATVILSYAGFTILTDPNFLHRGDYVHLGHGMTAAHRTDPVLEPVIRRSIDIAAMARLSVGPTWASLTETQRQQLSESFGRYMSAIYADPFDIYGGQELEVTGEQPASFGVIVKSQITKANGEPVKVDYMMRLSGDNWLISDIYLDGVISEVATRRSEFAAILKTEGIDGLISALNPKAESSTASSADGRLSPDVA